MTLSNDVMRVLGPSTASICMLGKAHQIADRMILLILESLNTFNG